MAQWHNGAEGFAADVSCQLSDGSLTALTFLHHCECWRQIEPAPLRTAAHISMSWVLCYCTWPVPCTRSTNKACHLSADDCLEQQTDIRGEVRSTDQAVQWGLTEINSCRWSHGNIDLSFSIMSHWSSRTDVIKKNHKKIGWNSIEKLYINILAIFITYIYVFALKLLKKADFCPIIYLYFKQTHRRFK